MNETRYEDIDLSDLIEDQRIKTSESLKASIEAHQEEILDRLVGWSHAGTYPKELVTSIGRINLTVVRMKRPAAQGGGTTSPILDALSVRKKRYSDELRMLLASKASRMSYDDTQKDFHESSRLVVPKPPYTPSCRKSEAVWLKQLRQLQLSPTRRNSSYNRRRSLVRIANHPAGSGDGWNGKKK